MTDKTYLPSKPRVLPKTPQQSLSVESPVIVSENNFETEDGLIIDIEPNIDTEDR